MITLVKRELMITLVKRELMILIIILTITNREDNLKEHMYTTTNNKSDIKKLQ